MSVGMGDRCRGLVACRDPTSGLTRFLASFIFGNGRMKRFVRNVLSLLGRMMFDSFNSCVGGFYLLCK